jgi:adenosylcobinamide-GDP ribazoletransferase
MNRHWNYFLTAVMLLTRLPVGRWCVYSPEAVAASVAYFPAVGAIVGMGAACVLAAMSGAFSVKIAVLASMLASVLLTGGFHEDGLADAADGLFGGRTPAQRMEIMKDSRLGSYGALALWFALSAKFILLEAVASHGLEFAAMAVLCAHCVSRAAAVGVMHLQPHVGADASRSQPFCRRLTREQLWGAFALPVVLLLFAFQTAALPVIAAVTLLVFLSAIFYEKMIGGITGDCLGATVQISELAVLVVLLHKP